MKTSTLFPPSCRFDSCPYPIDSYDCKTCDHRPELEEYWNTKPAEAAGKELGFSHVLCDRCDSPLDGDRWEWFRENTERKMELAGHCCIDCLKEINDITED